MGLAEHSQQRYSGLKIIVDLTYISISDNVGQTISVIYMLKLYVLKLCL